MSVSLQDSFQSILGRIHDLSEFSGPEQESKLRTDNLLLELSRLEGEIKLEALEATNDPVADSRTSRQAFVEQLEEKLVIARRRLRKSQVNARTQRGQEWLRNRESLLKPPKSAKEMREDLFSGHSSEKDSSKDLSYDDQVVTASASITQSLRRLHQMAQGEIIKSELNIEELDTSTKALTELHNKYSAVDVLLNGSRRLVQVLDEADAWDRRLMLGSLSFLAVVLLWILYRRVFKLPLKLLFWTLARALSVAGWFVPRSEQTAAISSSSFSSAYSTATEPIAPISTAIEPVLDTTHGENIIVTTEPVEIPTEEPEPEPVETLEAESEAEPVEEVESEPTEDRPHDEL